MTSSLIRPARQGSFKPEQFTGYLAGAVGTAALFSAPQAEAAVTAVTFGFGSTYTASDGTNNWSVGTGFGTMYGFRPLDGSQFRLGFGQFNDYESQVYHNGGLDVGLPQFFANGTVIGTGFQHGQPGQASFLHTILSGLDFTTDQLNKNIGFRTSSKNWGWANVSWTEATKTLAINEAWVESTPNTAITINVASVPEPSRALLALAGLGGVALLRRRKQVV